jgi:DNA-binding CsgD family transcriptional regulator
MSMTQGSMPVIEGAAAACVLDVFDTLGYGGFLLDADRKVLAYNNVARNFLDARLRAGGLTLHEGRVAATERASDKSLQSVIDAALTGKGSASVVSVGVRRDSRLPLLMVILRFSADAARLLLLACDPERRPMPPLHMLAEMFGLTPAEAGVAAGGDTGRQLAEIAADRSIGIETVRWYSKVVFGKTQTRGQAELAALLTRLAVLAPNGGRGSDPSVVTVARQLNAESTSTSATGCGSTIGGISGSWPVAHSDDTLQKIIWIASYPKSGNTWVRVFIHNLLREMRGTPDDAQDINGLSRHRDIDARPYQQLLGRPPSECSSEEIARVRPEVQRLHAAASSQPFFMKTHLLMAQCYGFSTINLDATLAAIYIVRNPLDVAISYAHHAAQSIDRIIALMADPVLQSHASGQNVHEVLGSWSSHVASWMSVFDRPVFVMRYEDMLRSPLAVFGRLAGFLRLAPTRDQLHRAIDKSSFSELTRQEQEKGFREKPAVAKKFFRTGTADQWRDVLTKEQVRRVVYAHAPMMQRAGYVLPNCGGDVLPQPGQRRQEDATIRQMSGAEEATLSIEHDDAYQ